MAFRAKIEQTAKQRQSNIILALDFPFENPENRNSLFKKAEQVLNTAHPYLCAVKFNHHLVLPLGVFDGIQKLVQQVHDHDLLAIMDCKANDIGATNEAIASYYYAAGFDALIANPFIGWEEGLKPIFNVAREQQRGVILLTYMSHKVPIFSPGIGAQGGEITAALKAGARYLIVGRAIVQAEDPAAVAKEIRDLARL